MSRILIFDNGGRSIKLGWASNASTDRTISNGIFRSNRDKRTYLADEFDNDCADYGGIVGRLPFDRGILTNWDVEKAVWDRLIKDVLKVNTAETSFLLTEPVFNLPNVQESYDQVVFEEYGFAAYARSTSPGIVGPTDRCGVVIDSGFSFTYIVPILFGEIAWKGVRRIDIGGKVLTNWMKELVSFRHWFMMDQTQLLSTVKEKTCFLSLDLARDLRISKASTRENDNICRYVLPDFLGDDKSMGYILDPSDERTAADFASQQVLSLNNERFTVPEALFQPSLIGLNQGGIAEAVADAVQAMPIDLQGLFWESILCIGGNACFANFQQRLFTELRALAPSEFVVNVEVPEDPVRHTLHTARKLLRDKASRLRQSFVTRAEFLEHGSNICRKRFAGPDLGAAWAPDRGMRDISAEPSSPSSDEEKQTVVIVDEEGKEVVVEVPVEDDGKKRKKKKEPKKKPTRALIGEASRNKKNRGDYQSYRTAVKGPKKPKPTQKQFGI